MWPFLATAIALLRPEKVCVLPQMGNLAKTWVVGGHSMGGAAASMYMAKPEANPAFRGMMFLARCASRDLHRTLLEACWENDADYNADRNDPKRI
jgi:hypothetical protein